MLMWPSSMGAPAQVPGKSLLLKPILIKFAVDLRPSCLKAFNYFKTLIPHVSLQFLSALLKGSFSFILR